MQGEGGNESDESVGLIGGRRDRVFKGAFAIASTANRANFRHFGDQQAKHLKGRRVYGTGVTYWALYMHSI